MKDLLNVSIESMSGMQIVDWAYTEELIPRTYQEYLTWVANKHNGPLKYLEDERKEKRESLKNVFPECESSLVFLFDYRAAKKFQQKNKSKFNIASYSIGFEDQDYHSWIWEKLDVIGATLKQQYPDLEYKVSLDIHPVLERDMAYRSGLGWFGKNSMLISREFGSYNLIGSLLINRKLSLNNKEIETDHCGTCTKCIDACPTSAIHIDSRTIETSKCISTFTIELFKDAGPPAGYPTTSNEVFGCDICQEVCPWNHKTLNDIGEIQFSRIVDFFNRDLELVVSEVSRMSNKEYKTYFKNTSMQRLGKKGLLKNLKYYQELE